MVTFFTVIQIIFSEKFVSQDFTIRADPGLSGPTNTCAVKATLALLHSLSIIAVLTFCPKQIILRKKKNYKEKETRHQSF